VHPRKSDQIRLKDVARRADVSPSTVSRVLNEPEKVATRTRARVLAAVEALRYRPNRHARDLAGKSSRTVGLIVSNLANPFFVDIYHSVEYEAKRSDYEVLIENTGYDPERFAASVDSMLSRSLAGLVVVISEMGEPMMAELGAANLPVVIYDVGSPGENITNIRVNEAHGVRMAVRYLDSLGHRRFGFIGHHTSMGSLSQRRALLLEALSRRGHEALMAPDCEDSPEAARAAVRRLMAVDEPPTAVLCVNDYLAIGALRELRELGLRVPEDVSVVGFDNIHLSEYANPTLTTVNIPRGYIGRLAMERILGEGGSAASREILVQPDLVIRESTGPAPSE
jgi:DNA-binding LacI/PurR family transcriptional regulator